MTQQFDPIKCGFDTTPDPYPLGWPISDKVSVEPIRKQLANQVHVAHHSYVSTPRKNAVVNHGIFLDGSLVGAVSYAYLLASSPICGYDSDEYIEVARVTIAIDMPNLASCAMAASQDLFTDTYAADHGIGLLVTYVHEDYEGTMFAALKSKGWEQDRHVEGRQAGNRPDNSIRDVDKYRWVCELTGE